MTLNPISMGNDGYYHPATEAELVCLVQWAHAENRQLRVRGSMHSFPKRAILTDGEPGQRDQELNLMLDRYRAVRFPDDQRRLVEVEAGCNLSINPNDPTSTSTIENGLLFQLQQRGWALSDLGGITHQTVSGFLATGSSGGSIKYGIDENIVSLRFIDGTGQIHEVSRDSEPDLFSAFGVSMGLLGVLSRVTFKCVPTYNIVGEESTSGVTDCAIDLFGAGSNERPSLENFLRETDYSRLIWWPQAKLNRVVVWKARRVEPRSDFVPKPYEELAGPANLLEVLTGLLLGIIGNLPDLHQLPRNIQPLLGQLDRELLEEIPKLGFSRVVSDAFAAIITGLIEFGLDGFANLPLINFLGRTLLANLDTILPVLYGRFVPLDSEKSPPEPQQFQDYWWTGLPMDNGIDDRLMPTYFTELWIPLSKTRDVMNCLRDYFERGGLAATGTYAFEIYAARPSPFWMSPSSDGEPVVRIDVFWFGYNAAQPDVAFYPQFWQLLKPFGFKLHWGKYLPRDPLPEKRWATYLSEQHRHWNDFLATRARLDPKNVFLTDYWREHLALEAVEPRRPKVSRPPKPDPLTSSASGLAAERAVQLYSWLLVAALAYGIVAAHLPALIGHAWSSCNDFANPTGCVVTFHFLEIPIVCYLLAFAVYGLRHLSSHLRKYASLLNVTLTALGLFLLFEVNLILDSFRRDAPTWEVAALFSVASLLLGGIVLGIHTKLKLLALERD